MKYTSNKFSMNFTRVSYLQSDINSVMLIHDIERRGFELYPDDDIIIVTAQKHTPDSLKSIAASGAGFTTVGLNKHDAQRIHSYAKFKHHINRHKKQTLVYESIDEMKDDALETFRETRFKSNEAAKDFFPVMKKIRKGLDICDQSLAHMMAKYAINYDKASSKGNCGITRNCRNIYTIDCDESIDYDTLVSLMTFKTDIVCYNTSKEVFDGVGNMARLVKRIYDLTGALPHIVYNEESAHFQLQYLMDKPIYVTEDASAALYKSKAAANRDTAFTKEHTRMWESIFNRSFHVISNENPHKVGNLYEIVNEKFKTTRRILLVSMTYDKQLDAVEYISSDVKPGDIKNQLLSRAASHQYTSTVDLGIKMFELARNCKLLVTTPEYYLYGNAHKTLGYLNTVGHKFVDINYNYCANKSLCIGTDYSKVFDTEAPDTLLSREQIIYDAENQSFSVKQFNLLTEAAWQYASDYAIDTKFVAFLGSLESAEQIFEDDIMDQFNSFKKTHSFMADKNVSMDECHKALKDKTISISKQEVSPEMQDDAEYDAHIAEIVNECRHSLTLSDTHIPSDINDLCTKYLGVSYEDCFIHLVKKIEDDALNNRTVSRHRFDYASGLSVFYKAISYNVEFCEACKQYNASLVTTEYIETAIADMDKLVVYLFNDIVDNVYGSMLPGTNHADKYIHKFDVRKYIISVDPKCFDICRAKSIASRQGVIKGAFATSLWSGSTKLELIPNMFSLLPTYIYSERLLQERLDATSTKKVNKYYKKSERPLYKKAWVNLLDESFDPTRIEAPALQKISTLYKTATYMKNGVVGVGIKHITRRELEESGVSYYLKKDKHIAEYCLETTSHFKVKDEVHGNINRYISSLEYFNNFLIEMMERGDWCAIIKDESIEPSLDDEIKSGDLDVKVDNKYIVKDRDTILSQIKTYRYFTKMYVHITATLKAVDEPSEEEHIIRLQNATHELYDTLYTFLTGLYDVLTSYNNTDYTTECENIESITTTPSVKVEEAITELIDKIELFYNTVDFFSDMYDVRDFLDDDKYEDDWPKEKRP